MLADISNGVLKNTAKGTKGGELYRKKKDTPPFCQKPFQMKAGKNKKSVASFRPPRFWYKKNSKDYGKCSLTMKLAKKTALVGWLKMVLYKSIARSFPGPWKMMLPSKFKSVRS